MVDRLFHERLPDGWSFGVSNDGRVFFIDDIRQRTTWIHPVLGFPLQSGHFSDESLPAGWEMNFDLLGKPYYVDHGTHLTTSVHPRFQDSPVYSPPEPRVVAENHSAFSGKQTNLRKSFSRRKSLSDPPTAKRDPLAPIVKQGWLYKQESGFMKSWKRRWGVLTSYCLFLYKTPDDSEQNEVCSVLLAGYWINPCSKSDKAVQKFAFKIEHKDTKPVYLAAETEEEMWEWLENLTKAAAVPGLIDPAESKRYETDLLRNKENLFMDDGRIPKQSSLQDKNLTGLALDYDPRAVNASNHPIRNDNLFQPHGQSSAFSHFDGRTPQRNSFGSGMQFSMQEPSATSMPVINTNNPDWYAVPQRSSLNRVSSEGLQNQLNDGFRGESVDYRDGGRFPGPSQKEFEDIHERTGAAPWQTVPQHNFDRFGPQLPLAHSFSKNPHRDEMDGRLNGVGGHYSFPHSRSVDGSAEFSLAGRREPPAPPRAWQEPSRYAQDQTSRHANPQYSHKQLRSDRLFDGGDHVPEPTFDRNRYSQPHLFRPVMQSSEDGDYLPPRPPVPVALRNMYIDDLAETKTPHSKQDILQAKELSQRRLNEPNFFQFPESPPKQIQNPYNYSNELPSQSSHYAEVSRHRSQQKSNPADVGPQDVNRVYHQREPAFESRPQGAMLDRLQQENRINKATDELSQPSNSHLLSNDITADPWKGTQMTNDPYNSVLYASVSPKINQTSTMASRAIEPIKEDPDMSDTDVLNTRTLQDMQKHMLGHARLRLSISVTDLVGKSQEELVLLLIQLRRSQAKLEEMLTWAKNRLSSARPQEKAYKLERKNSIGRLEDALEHGHEYFVQLQKQADEIEKQIDVTQPLINLLDNIVTMGSLYNGDGLMYASQYKKGQLRQDQIVPTKKMLEFSRMNQEVRLSLKQEQSLQQLTEDEVDLEEKLQQLYALDTELQDYSNAVTSLQEDKTMLEKMLDDIKKAERSETDHSALQHLAHQRQMCEKNLLSVRQNLADASKRLEEANTENARVEQQVVLLRNKIHGGLVKSQSVPSLLSSSGREAVKMEEELKSMKAVMEDLASQGTKISEAMENLKSAQPGSKAASAVVSSRATGYQETDLDTKVSRDISVRQGVDNRMGSYWPATRNENYGSARSSHNSFPSSSSMSKLPSDRARIEYRYVAPPTAQQIRPPAHSRPPYQPGGPSENQYRGQRGIPLGHQAVVSNSFSSRNNGYGDQWNDRHNNQFEFYGSAKQPSYGNRFEVPASSFDEINKRPYGGFSKDQMHPVSVRDVKKREQSRRNPGDYQLDDDARYSVLRRSRSLPRVNANNAGFLDFGRQSMNENTRRKSLVYLPMKSSKEKVDCESSSAMQRLFPSREHAGQITGHLPASYRDEIKRSQSAGTLSKGTEAATNRSRNELQGRFAGSLQGDQNREVMGPAVTNETRFTPAFSTTQNSSRPIFTSYDPAAIDDDYSGEFQRPQPVEIPDRYIPDSSDEDESLSLEERLRRKEKADQFKKMIAKQSLQEFSQGELTLQTGPVHHQVNDETRRREKILDVKHSLAQEVMLRSKEDAALRRKDWANAGMLYAQDGRSNAR